MKKYIVGNWKMNQTISSIDEFFSSLDIKNSQCETWVAPQAIHLGPLLERAKNTNIKVGVQNICEHEKGAFTGEISALSAKDMGATFCLVGHSERRSLYSEDDDLLNKKVHSALKAGMTVIFCIGEQLIERQNGMTNAVLKNQLIEGLEGINANSFENGQLLIAYEPVWAIGTGEVASPEQAQEAHAHIRAVLAVELRLETKEIPLLYGGSVKPANAEGLLSQKDIDGALVGGASLKGDDFTKLASL